MPKDTSIKKVLMIGSGPIVIGQAAEFDYAGAQACRILKSEGIETVLVNSNPATIMTDFSMADEIYLEPLNAETVKRIILKEKSDCVLAGLGGQTGLTIAMQLSEDGFLAEHNVRLIGTNAEAIKKAEDRQAFKDTMESIGQPVIPSKTTHDLRSGKNCRRNRLPGHNPSGVYARRRGRRRGLRRGAAQNDRKKRACALPDSSDTR